MSVKDKINWGLLGIKIITFLQTFLPAFLYAWVEHLRTKNAKIETELSYEKMKAEKKEAIDEHKAKNNNQSSAGRVAKFLRKKRDSVRK